MVNKLDDQTFTSDFESHWVPHSYGLPPHLNKNLHELLFVRTVGISGGVMVNKLVNYYLFEISNVKNNGDTKVITIQQK